MSPARLLLVAALAAIHSFTPVRAVEDPATLTQPAPARRTPAAHHDPDLVQRATTYETTSPLPLTQYQYPYSALPYQVNPYPIGRGPQAGYNQCNATTEGPTSECQTMEVNSAVRTTHVLISLILIELLAGRLLPVGEPHGGWLDRRCRGCGRRLLHTGRARHAHHHPRIYHRCSGSLPVTHLPSI